MTKGLNNNLPPAGGQFSDDAPALQNNSGIKNIKVAKYKTFWQQSKVC